MAQNRLLTRFFTFFLSCILLHGNDAWAAGYYCKELIEYVLCFDGNYMNDGKCDSCAPGSYCKSENPDTTTTVFSCATETGNEFATSASGSDSVEDCFITCEDVKVYWGGDSAAFRCDCPYYEKMGATGCEPCNIENALSYIDSKDSNCQVAECAVGFHPVGNKCEPNVIECTDAIENAARAEATWDNTAQTFSECTVTECVADYHVYENACVSDTETCQLSHGTGTREWNHSTNTWDKCIATTCEAGFTNDPNETNATDPTQCGECVNAYGPNGERVVFDYVVGCEIARCMNEGEQYVLDNNQCRLICTGSDETGERYWDEDLRRCVHTCYAGYGGWSDAYTPKN